MNRVYLLNQPLNASTFTVYTKGGNGVCYQFRGGNVNTKTLASFMTENEYYQSVLENSEQFKSGIVVWDKATAKAVAEEKVKKAQEEAEKAAAMEEKTNDALTAVENITSVSEAINYVAEHFGKVAKTAKQAKEIAKENGVDFVNLKTGKN